MTGKDVEQTDERDYGPGPWWADLGTWGAVGLIAFGCAVAAWGFLRLPGAPQEMATGYYMAAKIVAVGLVVAGSSLLGRRCDRVAATGGTRETDPA
ncbi:hypothetical protein [Streptomyces sp. AS02]|uniref:hypothetical protein n=1 Tax=Streptomyces sp. AS02 TaxID=2938946 RepID=UPI002021F5BE|nr:hypothetical protein [Streptomyces sp. AS02]MCL8013526.1 hypothetical protein [Streptomyces sp. AS02]